MKILTTKHWFVQSKYDKCLFYCGNTIYLLYTDNSIIAETDKKEIETIIDEIQWSKLNITILGDIKDFLGIHVSKESDGRMHISQPYLIDQTIN